MKIGIVYDRVQLIKDEEMNYFISSGHYQLIDDLFSSDIIEELVLFSRVKEINRKILQNDSYKLLKNKVIELEDNKIKTKRYFRNFLLLKEIKNLDVLIIWLPSYNSLLALFISLFIPIRIITITGGDWWGSFKHSSDLISKKGDLKDKFMEFILFLSSDFLERFVAKKSSFVLTHSRRIRKYKKNDIYIALPETSLNLQDFYYKFNSFREPFNLLYVGSLVELKGIKILIYSIKELLSKGYDIRLKIVGEGLLKEELKNLVEDLEIGDFVKFYGYVPNGPKLWKYYRKSDIFILPSKKEGFPRVIYEAMSQGLPIISTVVGDIPNRLKNRESALLIPPNSVEHIVYAVIEMLENKEIRNRLRKNGYKIAKKVFETSSGKYIIKLIKYYFFK